MRCRRGTPLSNRASKGSNPITLGTQTATGATAAPDIVVSYTIDGDDRICAVDNDWLRFAQANDAHELQPAAVIGRSLWDFIRSHPLKLLYQRLLTQVRATRRSVRFSFRCDSPEMRRLMSMELSPREHGRVEFISQLVMATSRESSRVVREGFNARLPMMFCGICNRIRVGEQWLEVEEAVAQGLIMAQERELMVVHGVCQECRHFLSSRAEALRKQA